MLNERPSLRVAVGCMGKREGERGRRGGRGQREREGGKDGRELEGETN